MSIARHPLIMFATKPAAASSYLLDTYTGAAAAYSLRQLKTGITSVVRVRRSSDNTEADFTATEITNGTLTTWTGANNGFVVTWYDQSGNGNNATQTISASQPQLVSAGVVSLENGKPIIISSSGKGLILGTNLEISTFWAFEAGKSSHNSAFLGLVGVTNALSYAGQSSGANYNSQTTNIGMFLNGISLSITTRTELLAELSNYHLITHNYSTTTNRNILGYTDLAALPMRTTHEVIIYNSDQSANRIGIETEINNYYGIY